ncbi:general odorant-binding protein 72-like [Onthophagus taurus]|uniref:general odorant-binding protein 72-like n=1 Tax=Onthophagus taurus TaxID=166361 RepID=UPI000C209157|nr:uncharacterized protein LOC111427413 isoform X2 [Onthophagus taurus]
MQIQRRKMKIFLGLFGIFVCSDVVFCLTEAQIKQTGKLIRRSCSTKYKADIDELDGFIQGKFDNPTEAGKCYLHCALGMMKMVKKDGHIDYESGMKQVPLLPEPRRAPASHALNECKTAGDDLTQKCDIAVTIAKCSYDSGPEHYIIP